MNPKYGYKNYNDSSIYCRVIRKNKKIKTKKITTFSRENVRENNKKFIENNMGIKIVYIYSSKHQIIQVMLCNKITLYFYILSL